MTAILPRLDSHEDGAHGIPILHVERDRNRVSTLTTGATQFWLGRHNDDTSYANKRFYDGTIRDVRVYKQPSSAARSEFHGRANDRCGRDRVEELATPPGFFIRFRISWW